MSTFNTLTQKDTIEMDGKRWTVFSKVDDSIILQLDKYERYEKFHKHYIDSAQVVMLKKLKDIKNMVEVLNLSDSEKLKAEQLKDVALTLRNMDKPFGRAVNNPDFEFNGQVEIRKLYDRTGRHHLKVPSKGDLCRILEAFRKHKGDMSLYVSKKRKKQSGRLSDEKEQFITQGINDHYLKCSDSTIQSTVEYINRQVAPPQYDGKAVSYTSVRRRIEQLRMERVIAERDGKHALRMFNRGGIKNYKPKYISERVELDAAHLTIGIVDKNNRFLGYCTLYLALDCATRAIVGYYLEVKEKVSGETTSGVMNSIYNMLSNNAPHDVNYHYPMCCLPIKIVMDQGTAYKNKLIQGLCNSLQIDYQYTGTKSAWGKPFVESFIGTLRKRFGSNIEAYRKSNDAKKALKERPELSCAVYLDELKVALDFYIHHCYHNEKHSGMKEATPKQKWHELYEDRPPCQADDIDFQYFRGKEGVYTLHSSLGIRLLQQEFHSTELKSLYKELKLNDDKNIELHIKYNLGDASAINVFNPLTKEWLHVPNKDDEINVGVSFTEVNAELKHNKNRPDEAKHFNADDHFTETKVSRNKKKRSHSKVPCDDGNAPVSREQMFEQHQLDMPHDSNTFNVTDITDCEFED